MATTKTTTVNETEATEHENKIAIESAAATAAAATATAAEELTPQELTAMMLKNIKLIPGLKVVCEKVFSKTNSKHYTNFYVPTKVRGREYKAYVSTPKTDQTVSSYEYVETLFGGNEMHFGVEPYAMKDKNGNVESRGVNYYAVSIDPENGEAYSIKIQPKGAADKGAIFANLTLINLRNKLGLEL